MSARRAARGQHAAATTPRIISLNLARRSGGRPSRSASGRAQPRTAAARPVVQLGALFEMERRVRGLESAPASPPPREEEEDDSAEQEEEKWQFQAEILRAECNFLRMEREVALRKLDRHRGQMEAALKSAVETLVTGRKKIDGRGDVGVAAALDEGIENLEEMMEELRGGQGEREEGHQRAAGSCGAATAGTSIARRPRSAAASRRCRRPTPSPASRTSARSPCPSRRRKPSTATTMTAPTPLMY
ncbi:hypothetical protein PR202_ga26580 [Eleusine coracana subsp. coracana]|uniref:Uncharacterized protein n=1 Tax=Eleusine coracana subsp. coracana TaxID=191504 RepID=A0AAV5DC92_ELECO|nr:hypothetical protein PR202_ga26580 [Eleusine coracana subsp. coracana]